MEALVKDISRRYGKVTALNSVSFGIRKNELLSLIGPSGSGKTTLLKILAGIEKSDKGILFYPDEFSGKKILVFQDYHLFPHMTIYENVAFGLKAAKKDKSYIQKQVLEYLSLFHIEEKKNAYPGELSGGQKQRAVIARAMVLEPSLLLLDEPFANLDKNLKMETAGFIRDIQQRLKTTTVCVTHDLDEAFAVSDRIGILLDGELIQISDTEDIYFNPVSKQAADFLGAVNRIPEELSSILGLSSLEGEGVRYLRPELFRIQKNKNGLGTIVEVSTRGGFFDSLVEISGTRILVRTMDGDFSRGEQVKLTLSDRYYRSLEDEAETREA